MHCLSMMRRGIVRTPVLLDILVSLVGPSLRSGRSSASRSTLERPLEPSYQLVDQRRVHRRPGLRERRAPERLRSLDVEPDNVDQRPVRQRVDLPELPRPTSVRHG